ncbi:MULTISPECIES: patatin family protein [unclassified Streptococcus]|uniref:patatin-like phospholipase family protein n=1 Tax=unclassified Streptococcus TaxID=2608887 RepID=UPI0010721491|nr:MULTISPECIES: patatin family protein [unclassified Streptococcus]MBF0805938.1 patatin family protein [Streptococcus sp. 19428wA2_WM07]TFU28510.1 patatin family protein [Streptococcus sp. WM07]
MKVGLVLEGGGMRGLYTAGVLDAFLDVGIKVDGLVSVSAGALFGVNFLSGQRGRALRYNKRFIRDKNYISLLSWLKTGNMVNREMAYYKIPMELDIFDQEAFAQSGVPFYVTVTNLETGQAEYPKIDHVFDQMEYLRASSALPLISQIVEIDGKKYLDGGLTDSIPVDFAKSLGFDKLIVILTQPLDYRKKASSGRLYRLFYKEYPKFVEVASKRYQYYNDTVEKIIRMEEAGEIYVIRPEQSLAVRRLERDPEKLEAVYTLGFQDSQRKLMELKHYLATV